MESRILTVPNWSFGRDRRLLSDVQDLLVAHDVRVHFARSDVDHNRTVTAFSGGADAVHRALISVAERVLPGIDLNRHVGVHPRVGGLDVCPFVPLSPEAMGDALVLAETVAADLAGRFEVPVYLYERSERGRHEADLPSLRRGGFGGLAGRELRADFGPSRAHARLGVTVLGVRDFLIAMNVNLATEDVGLAKELARRIRALRQEGDARFLGVRALGLPLPSRGLTQVSTNLTLPDLAPIDPVIEWVRDEARGRRVSVSDTELIGVIRRRDLLAATRVPVDPAQVVD